MNNSIMLLIKVLLLQTFWFSIVLFGKSFNPMIQLVIALILVFSDFLISKPTISIGRYFFLVLLFFVFGFINDFLLLNFELISNLSYQWGNLSLWIVFIMYYDKVFLKFKNISFHFLMLIGGIAGALTYLSAAKFNAIEIFPNRQFYFMTYEFLFWGLFFPMSLKLFFSDKYWNTFLDRLVVFSFDHSGFIRHKKVFEEDFSNIELMNKNSLVTGATGGIGASVANFLSNHGSHVIFTGRNLDKGQLFEKNNKNSKFESLDMSNWDEVYQFSKNVEPLDYLVLNAGSMPEQLTLNKYGFESQCASQLLGHYFLLIWLHEFDKLKNGARIVWVSSGGMYLKKLDLNTLFENKIYDKVETYANVKRAQITLVEELSKINKWDNYFIYSMHPGWVKTEGLKDALPRFYQLMEKRLRTIEEGADTILWCLLTAKAPYSGNLYFDRKKVSAYITKSYFPSIALRSNLLESIHKIKIKLGY